MGVVASWRRFGLASGRVLRLGDDVAVRGLGAWGRGVRHGDSSCSRISGASSAASSVPASDHRGHPPALVLEAGRGVGRVTLAPIRWSSLARNPATLGRTCFGSNLFRRSV